MSLRLVNEDEANEIVRLHLLKELAVLEDLRNRVLKLIADVETMLEDLK